MKFLWISHFSGCGGSTLGAIAAGFTPVMGIEWDSAIARLYQDNINSPLQCVDIANCDRAVLGAYKQRSPDEILVMQTSPPCQDFSRSNRGKNPTGDRANIISSTYWQYELLQPEYVILENVPQYATSIPYRQFKEFMLSLGYVVSEHILDAQDFGVPQRRKRLFAIYVKDGFSLPVIEYTQRIGWYEAIFELIPSLLPSTLTSKQRDRITCAHPALIERLGYYDTPAIAYAEDPCWTIRASIGSDHKGANRSKFIDVALSENDVRSLSVEALARLQSFPHGYRWTGSVATNVRGIGNAVPPRMMQAVCRSIVQMYSTNTNKLCLAV